MVRAGLLRGPGPSYLSTGGSWLPEVRPTSDNALSSVGAELRIQLPVVNVPFRLIYAFNPNARDVEVPGIEGLRIRDRKRTFRFSIGRTF